MSTGKLVIFQKGATMNIFRPVFFLSAIAVFFAGPVLDAQSIRETAENAGIPLRKITIYSSGVAFFEHSGDLSGPARITLPFKLNTVNDALKSLVVNDPVSASPLITYPSEEILWETLRSLSVDLSGSPGMAEILSRLRGEEVEIAAPGPITGRITALDYRAADGESAAEPWLSLLNAEGIKLIRLDSISSLRFTDPRINADLGRALDLIRSSRNAESRKLTVSLPGIGSRQVSISYVIPAPVWKAAYRLDLSRVSPADSRPTALLQGWAIVDNAGDADWRDVELSLVAGRPASFIQNLYPPYYVDRPTLPLALAGSAEAETWDSGFGGPADLEAKGVRKTSAFRAFSLDSAAMESMPVEAPAPSVAGGNVDTARTAALGDQFSFTFKSPVSLDRQQSAMLPLVEGTVSAAKLLILSGERALGNTVHPYLGAELINATGIDLPAGPLTVYDGGAYAGDALIEFFSRGEKRLISWGEDLSVTASAAAEPGGRFVSAVSVSGGLMTISRKWVYRKTYTVKNAAGEAKQLIIEHPVTPGTELAEPAKPAEKTPAAYRFLQPLPARGELVFTVREEQPVIERISLVQQRPDTLLSYADNQEIPQNIRAALQKALALKEEADTAHKALDNLQSRRNSLASEQDRIRQNLEAAGNQSPQGQEYLKWLVQLDRDLDQLAAELDTAEQKAQGTQKAYEHYLGTLKL
jgi:hypothetical protein